MRFIEFAKSLCELNEEPFSSYTTETVQDSTKYAEGDTVEEAAIDDYDVWSVGTDASTADTAAPSDEQTVTSIQLCQLADATTFVGMYVTTETGGVPTDAFLPDGSGVD